jgi:hypothetical protein
MEQIYKGYATFDAMTQTDFFFRTDTKKRSAGILKAAAKCIIGHRLRHGLKLETAEHYDIMCAELVKRMQGLNALQPATLEYSQSEKWGKTWKICGADFSACGFCKDNDLEDVLLCW